VSLFGKRGEYPIKLGYREDVPEIPGIVNRRGTYYATIDAAEVIGVRAPVSLDQIGPLDLAPYRLKGYPEKLRPYQKEDAAWLASRRYAIHRGPMRCVAGDTTVVINRGGASKRMRIDEVVAKFPTWSGITHTQSMTTDGLARLNQIEKVWDAGIKEAIRFRTESGHELTCSTDHQVLTQSGWVRAKHLRVLDYVRHTSRTRLTFLNNDPSNLEAITQEDHSRKHAMDGAWRHCQTRTAWTRIVQIELVPACQMYDLTVGEPHNYIANGLVVHNSGKSRTVTAAATLINANRVLIIGPAIARQGWVKEIKECESDDLLILLGRKGDLGRQAGKRVKNPTPGTCRWTFVNYDILSAHHERSPEGKMIVRPDLPGWAGLLAKLHWDLVILDESQHIRGIKQGFKATKTRADACRDICARVPTVWATTGTPMMGKARDLWTQLDVISGGLWGRNHFAFDVRYCSGGHYGYGGAWTVGSEINQDELRQRLTWFVRSRTRAEILPHLPAKTRQVIRIDPEGPIKQAARGDNESKATRQLRATLQIKIPRVIENVTAELAEGCKVLVLTDRKESCEQVHAAFAKLKNLPGYKIWLGDGRVTVDARVKMAEAFRNHLGSGVFVSNIAALSGGISLYSSEPAYPSTSVHFVEYGFVPEAMAQAEDRMNDPDNRSRGLAIVHYEVENSIDEHIGRLLLPKVESIVNVIGSESAESLRDSLQTPKEILASAWESWSQSAPLIEDDDD
jgi:hypothetical protein